MKPRIYLFGGSFDPIGVHHLSIIFAILAKMGPKDRLILIPCGYRTDGKESVNDTLTVHRAAMTELSASTLNDPRISVDLSDLERSEFTRTWDLDQRYRCDTHEVWHVIGTDQLRDKDGTRLITENWFRGLELFRKASFLVIPRDGYPINDGDLPPSKEILSLTRTGGHSGSSKEIRTRAFLREDYSDLVTPEVARYIARHHLYTGRPILGPTVYDLKGPGIIVVAPPPPDPADFDPVREKRIKQLAVMAERVNADRTGEPDHVLVIGGDGPMLHSAKDKHQLRLPFVGLNAGTRGFLLNDGTLEQLEERLRRGKVYVYRQPLLHAQFETVDGVEHERLAFNELYLQTTDGHSGCMKVKIDGVVRFAQLDGDGLMLSTAAGSTGWARSHKTTPIIIGTPSNLLTGVGVTAGMTTWSWMPLSLDSVVEVDLMQQSKRPMWLRADGRKTDPVRKVRMSVSRVYAAELAFFPETNLAEKLMELYLPPCCTR